MRREAVKPRCPAAVRVAGPPALGPSCVCSVLRGAQERADQIVGGTYSDGLITAAKDPSSYYGFCSGRGLPVVDSVPEGGRGHYTACPIWRDAREAETAAKEEKLYAPEARPDISSLREAAPRSPVGDLR